MRVSMPNCVRTRAIVCIRVGWRSIIGVGVGIGIVEIEIEIEIGITSDFDFETQPLLACPALDPDL
jgi:hypothetical protein